MSRFVLPCAILLTSTISLVFQFVQHTDSVFPLVYFTVDSAALAGAVAFLGLVRPATTQLPYLRAASAVAVLLSALIYAAVIAPASETGTWIQPHDDYWVRTATLLFHAATPALVTADFIARDVGRSRFRWGLSSCFVWPLFYLATISTLAGSGLLKMPYPFLDSSRVGGWVVLGTLAALALLIVILSGALWASNQLWRRVPRSPTSWHAG